MRIGLVGVGRIGAFHASTLKALPAVDQVVVADADPSRAEAVAKELGLEFAADVPALLASGLDGFVIAAATGAHAELIAAGVAAGVPTFCEKPVALDLAETQRVVDLVEAHDVPVHIGFQRRFDAGYQAARAAVVSGELGFVHHIRANTNDAFPPHQEYIPQSGGFFRDCSVHDFDAVRYVTGREIVSVYATGANRGEPFFGEYGDVDSAAALLTLDDGTFVQVSGTRYNGAGHDVRMELQGSLGSIAIGLDEHTALRSAEPGVSFPGGPPHLTFMDRFQPAYVAELTAFTEVAAGTRDVPCTVRDALAAFRIADACELSRHENRVVTL
ncbi:Gfo/Idh/MocA family oxidoreductase [Kribbella sandramycini]|uniref:Gfo/Idh/MocA family oxidoreductase n=1 Tax=Kribbella sandramycini TaxID=60450 RepID=A0A7Y4KWX3_9ACTN|nr:Gfo/Idh/MocA family oxidoreductase [Kribbella sandramycini]MBB6567283.1 myo-inositol 2-dehydrogenase/D-chiro-inositol 1-dehydrogenase [Kribbella sandramycini]NOL40104.1 Gfo/Idh/MocA family oxidoreductase [Kribbella sandramycini]